MDMSTIFDQYMVIPILVICFCIGYIIKNTPALEKVSNNFIPLICGILGLLLGVWMGGFNIQAIAEGLVSGLAATGVHQMYSQYFEHKASADATSVEIWEDGDPHDDED